MASKTNLLISGEAYARQKGTGAGVTDWGGAFSEGMNKYAKINAANAANRKAKQNAAATEMKGYINKMSDDISLENLSPDQQNSVTQFLIRQRNIYARAASNAAKIDSADPLYARYAGEMNSVNGALKTLKNNLDVYKQNKVQYANDIKQNTVSLGVDPADWQAVTNLYTGKSVMQIGQGGQLLFGHNGIWTDLTDMPAYFSKDYEAADMVLKTANDLYAAKRPLTEGGARYNLVRNQLLNQINKKGRESLLSLAYDDLITDGGLGVVPEEYLAIENEEALRNWVVDNYMNIYSQTAQAGYDDYNKYNTNPNKNEKDKKTYKSTNEDDGGSTEYDFDKAIENKEEIINSRYKNRKAVWDPRSNTYLIYFEKNGEWNLLVDQNSVAIGVDPKDPDFKYKILNHLILINTLFSINLSLNKKISVAKKNIFNYINIAIVLFLIYRK